MIFALVAFAVQAFAMSASEQTCLTAVRTHQILGQLVEPAHAAEAENWYKRTEQVLGISSAERTQAVATIAAQAAFAPVATLKGTDSPRTALNGLQSRGTGFLSGEELGDIYDKVEADALNLARAIAMRLNAQ